MRPIPARRRPVNIARPAAQGIECRAVEIQDLEIVAVRARLRHLAALEGLALTETPAEGGGLRVALSPGAGEEELYFAEGEVYLRPSFPVFTAGLSAEALRIAIQRLEAARRELEVAFP